jgi:hypothetical protein
MADSSRQAKYDTTNGLIYNVLSHLGRPVIGSIVNADILDGFSVNENGQALIQPVGLTPNHFGRVTACGVLFWFAHFCRDLAQLGHDFGYRKHVALVRRPDQNHVDEFNSRRNMREVHRCSGRSRHRRAEKVLRLPRHIYTVRNPTMIERDIK